MNNYEQIQKLLEDVITYATDRVVGGSPILGTPITPDKNAPIAAIEICRLLEPIEDRSVTVHVSTPRKGRVFLVDNGILRLTTESLRELDGATEMWDPATDLLTIALLNGETIPTRQLAPLHWW